ncbi:ubiquitin thiolesterase-like protein [Podospora appendiculata]|uniref:ubiquitinyl hydrolase 1 n=1 Tax=Podospora appendiculata TaxID=314037 RepID=A0AAE1CDV1_9PEZI|nr:ubiquitin thiolesterase-like protein [Podospora appendiculata]
MSQGRLSPSTSLDKGSDAGNGDPPLGDPPLGLRRSNRARKPPAGTGMSAEPDEAALAPVNGGSAEPAAALPRRNPKRKAAPEESEVPENLLEASLAPWEANERAEWPSWIEVESDPDFFNRILHLIGVKESKVEEVLSIDEESMSNLPDPVYGLVFLHQYVFLRAEETAETEEEPWFANQTTENACATVALFNIIMNADGLNLGDRLSQFKEESKGLTPPLRGNLLSNSSWIRVAHNSFARRIDLLNAALCLQNEVDEKKRRRTKGSSHRNQKTKPSGGAHSAYHFVGFVPVKGKVWQLDGLEKTPRCIGSTNKDQPWTSIVRPVLKARMMQYANDQVSFSLLALCGDHIASLRRELAANIRCFQLLEAAWQEQHNKPLPPRGSDGEYPILPTASDAQTRLKDFALEPANIPTLSEARPEVAEFKKELCKSSDKAEDGTQGLNEADFNLTWKKLCEDQTRIRSKYTTEFMNPNGEEHDYVSEVPGRKKDHTPAIHAWVQKLADHGVLATLHERFQELHSQ